MICTPLNIYKSIKKSASEDVAMALNIKDPETDRLARELATLTDESITTAIRHALEERLRTVRRQAAPTLDLSGIIARGRARATIDGRSADEILGYGDDGMPA